ncbi:MAG: aminomethyltransferase beta-barrel domain-containing protein, partial [Parasphingorhabdus sp.]
EPDFGISPGQACVFYEAPGQGSRVLGGGYIAGTLG